MERTYELVVLLHPDLEIDIEAPIAKVENIIKNHGGVVVKRENWGKKRLAYRIKKQDFAVYIYFEVSVDPTRVREIDNMLLITEEVLRHILVSHEEDTKVEAAKAAKEEKVAKAGEAEDKKEGEGSN